MRERCNHAILGSRRWPPTRLEIMSNQRVRAASRCSIVARFWRCEWQSCRNSAIKSHPGPKLSTPQVLSSDDSSVALPSRLDQNCRVHEWTRLHERIQLTTRIIRCTTLTPTGTLTEDRPDPVSANKKRLSPCGSTCVRAHRLVDTHPRNTMHGSRNV